MSAEWFSELGQFEFHLPRRKSHRRAFVQYKRWMCFGDTIMWYVYESHHYYGIEGYYCKWRCRGAKLAIKFDWMES